MGSTGGGGQWRCLCSNQGSRPFDHGLDFCFFFLAPWYSSDAALGTLKIGRRLADESLLA